EQRGLVAGRRDGEGAGILFLRCAAAFRISQSARSPGGGVLQYRSLAVPAEVRRCAKRRFAAPGAARLLPEHLRGCGDARQMESRGAGTQRLAGGDRLEGQFDLRALRQWPSVAGLMSIPRVTENVAPHRPERNPKGLLPVLLMPPGMAPRSPFST